MKGEYAPKSPGEINCRRARRLVQEARHDWPSLKWEVWAIAQGLAYIKVNGPTRRGLVDLVLHTETELLDFLSLVRDEAQPPEAPEFRTYYDSQGREHQEF